jgi:hypothetical protein
MDQNRLAYGTNFSLYRYYFWGAGANSHESEGRLMSTPAFRFSKIYIAVGSMAKIFESTKLLEQLVIFLRRIPCWRLFHRRWALKSNLFTKAFQLQEQTANSLWKQPRTDNHSINANLSYHQNKTPKISKPQALLRSKSQSQALSHALRHC